MNKKNKSIIYSISYENTIYHQVYEIWAFNKEGVRKTIDNFRHYQVLVSVSETINITDEFLPKSR
jgi:hypothetical protein